MKTEKPSQQPENIQQQLSVDEAYAQALEHFNAERYTIADQLCTAIIKAMPNHVYAINLIGLIAQRVGRHDLAIELFQKSISIDSNIALLYYNLGTSLFALGRTEEAVNNYQKSISINPDFIDAFSNLGVALQVQGKVEEAITSYKKAVSIKPDDEVVYSNLGNALKDQGQLEEAVKSYQKAISLKPDYAEAYSNLGVVLQKQWQLEEAVKSYQKAISLKPDFVDAHCDLIFCIDLSTDVQTDKFLTERIRWSKQHTDPLRVYWSTFENIPDPERKLRIGYVGADFKHHSAAYIFGAMLLDYDQTKFQVYCYAGNTVEDDLSAQFKKQSTKWLSTTVNLF
jgi:protein O-GlcNAc transferase